MRAPLSMPMPVSFWLPVSGPSSPIRIVFPVAIGGLAEDGEDDDDDDEHAPIAAGPKKRRPIEAAICRVLLMGQHSSASRPRPAMLSQVATAVLGRRLRRGLSYRDG